MSNQKIEFRYTKAYDHKTSIVTGVYGGITNQGLIDTNYFIEKVPLPEKTEIEIDSGGKLVTPESQQRTYQERIVVFETLMDLHTAKSVHQWLGNKIKDLEEAIKKSSNEIK